MAKLVLHRAGGDTRDILLDHDRITIGRRADHDICLPFPAVSADHAEIITVIADSFLHDLGSTNGTFVNGERVTKHFLRDHDKIDIGRQQLVYLTNDAETVAPLPAEKLPPREAAPEVAKVAREPALASIASRPGGMGAEPHGARIAKVDELMTDLMEMNSESSVAVDIAPTISAMRAHAKHSQDSHVEATAGGSSHASRSGRADETSAVVEILTGPHAGQVAQMHKPEFLFGKLGATVAAIRREGAG